MKKSLVFILLFSYAIAQNQGVGIGTLNPDASARLDVVSSDKGVLIPRVNLVATNNPAPVTNPAVSLLVYNQATINDVVPGFYYWDGTKWVSISAGGATDAWLINGNLGTNSNNNFVGTTDAQALTFRTNNSPRFRIANGNQVFGLNGGTATAPFYSWENDANTGLYNPGADELGLSTNGTERVRINNNGNVGINTTPNSSAILDINANNRGVRIPNVALVARNNNAPIGAGIVNSLLVYNTATSGTGANAVSPGYYYWNGTEWVRLIDNVTNDWTLLGNAGTDPTVNFIGTTDAQDFVTRTNNIERTRVTSGGNVGINTTPNSSAILDINANNRGVRIPNVALVARNNNAPIGAGIVNSLLVYNTATSGTGANAVSPGYYYWNGNEWVRLIDNVTNDWALLGNAGTDPTVNFIGTTDAQDFVTRTNNIERTRVTSGGNVGINTTPNSSAILDINANNRGVRIPNVALVARNNNAPIGAGIVNSLLVYNTATSGTGANAVSPGYYYWNGNEWVRLIDNVTNDWALLGNAGTDPTVNFIGTTDAQDFVTRTNNIERTRVTSGGNVGINTTPNSSAILDINANNRGVRIPNVALVARNNNAPIGAGIVNSLLVYNTATSGTGANAVSPGYYYWNGNEWVRLIDNVTNDWALLGNAGTDPTVNFIGTTDAQALTFRTNNTARFRIANGNQVFGLGNGTPNAPFYSWEADSDMGIFRASIDELGISTAGSERMRVTSNGNVGIGTSAPDVSAILDVTSSNKGILAPRVNLVAANNPAPVTAPATGLLVFNTATSGTYPNDVFPGYYYWNGTRWVRQVSQNVSVWYYPPTNINANTRYTLTGALPGVNPGDGVCVNLVGDWGTAPQVVVEHVEARTDQVRFVVFNRSLLTNYIGMDFVITIIKP